MSAAEDSETHNIEARPRHSSKTQSAISTKLFLALGFITVTAIIAGVASILALTRFQENFNTLINNELPTLEDTAYISQLSVTVANRGPSMIISPNTWARENIMGQITDDAQWLEEILTRVSNEALSGNRKQELLNLKEVLITTYTTLNTLTESRIKYAKRLEAIDAETFLLQQDMVALRFTNNHPGGAGTSSVQMQHWNESIHSIIFNVMKARRLKHPAPLKRLGEKVKKTLDQLQQHAADLSIEAQLATANIYVRIQAITAENGGLFAVKKADFAAASQTAATLRSARTIAERFMSASELAAVDISKSINAANQKTVRSMDFTFRVMVGFIIISALVAMMTFLYISRTVLRRLVNLRYSMVAHAEGTSNIIDTSGEDEITDMARSLEYLVDTLHSREVGLTLAKEEAEQASTAKTRFLAAASHDLRQPLQALNLFVYALEGKEKDEEKREIIHLIRNSLDALKELLNTLLDISKLEAGVVQPNMKDFAAGPMIERIKSELTAVAWASDLKLKTIASSAMVHCDPSLLETTVRNLVDNAIKYTEQGRVLVGCRHRGNWVRFEVWDTGPGIPEDQRELIFQDFYQIDNEARKRTHGLGLGLSIVKRMSDLMGCTVGCRSQPGKGSVFWIEVPTSITHTDQVRQQNGHATEASFPAGEGHIVLIEDDEQVLMGLKSLLEAQGYTTLSFQEANPALFAETFAIKQLKPDLIIADYRLEAQTTGSEAIRMMTDILDHDTPAIIITGDTAPERLREAKESGFPILHKPVRAEELMDAVRQAMTGTQANVSVPSSSGPSEPATS